MKKVILSLAVLIGSVAFAGGTRVEEICAERAKLVNNSMNATNALNKYNPKVIDVQMSAYGNAAQDSYGRFLVTYDFTNLVEDGYIKSSVIMDIKGCVVISYKGGNF